MFKSLKNFLYDMLTEQGKISSKRVVGFGCFLLITEVLQAVIWAGKETPSELLYVLAGLLTACFGMNAILSAKAITTKSTVASDIVKEKPSSQTAEDAKDILKSDKP